MKGVTWLCIMLAYVRWVCCDTSLDTLTLTTSRPSWMASKTFQNNNFMRTFFWSYYADQVRKIGLRNGPILEVIRHSSAVWTRFLRIWIHPDSPIYCQSQDQHFTSGEIVFHEVPVWPADWAWQNCSTYWISKQHVLHQTSKIYMREFESYSQLYKDV